MNRKTADIQASEAARQVPVWDVFVRVFHWSVALGFFVAYLSEDFLPLHTWVGYVVGVLVVMRVVWGFAGPEHARFSDFVCGPAKAWRYLLELVTFRARRYLGHSPAGGVMVLLLLAGLGATVWSGLEVHAIENAAGPLAAIALPVRAAEANEDDESEGDEENNAERRGTESAETLWEEAHETLADLTLFLVMLHVAGVALASIVHRENLVASMVNGSKRAQ